jgi:hypothetical protein
MLPGVELTTSFQDRDGALNKDELEDLFSTAPSKVPWHNQSFLSLDDSGAVTLQAWLARWRYV